MGDPLHLTERKQNMKTTKLGPFLGINNRRPDFSLKTDAGDYLKAADNVDITDAGNIVRRRGNVRLQAMTGAHSLKMVTPTTGFLVRASALYSVTLPAYTETLLAVLTSDATMSYAQLGNDLFYSNGTDIGRVTAGVSGPAGLAPMSAPALSTIGGDLLAGQYQVGVAYCNNVTGIEGAISDLAYIELAAAGGIRVTLPGVLDGATHINVYLSESNGTVPMLHSTVTVGTALIDLIALATGRPASQRIEDLLPAGTLFYGNGRLCSFKDGTVYVGLPFRPGYYLPLNGYVPFPEPVSIAIATQSGAYIVADKTYFVPGDLGTLTEKIREVLPCGAVPGTAFEVPHKNTVGWFSKRGFVLASQSGEVDASMADNVDVTPPFVGIANVTEDGGYRRVAGCGYAMNLENKAVTTYSDWAFTSASYKYGTKLDGIYQMDTADAAPATVNFGLQDFDSEMEKQMPGVYLGVSSAAPMNMRVKTPDMDYTYAARSAGVGMKLQRVDPGWGLRANWFELELSNTNGGDFTLATVSFAPQETTRRI